MIYTISSKVSSHAVIARVADHFGCVLIMDCRAKPDTHPARNKSTRAKLAMSLGERYMWAGDRLGGFGNTTSDGIRRLADSKANLLLLCACEAPGSCHLHQGIGKALHDLGVDVAHIWRNELIPYTVLRDMTDEQSESGEYAFTELPDHLFA